MEGRTQSNSRIDYLDGLRGVAVALVVVWHYLGLWFEGFGPYSDKRWLVPFFAHGWIGVYLFFLISGFVIMMTLQRSKSFGDFISRRWLRLFPAMLLASLFIWLVVSTLGLLQLAPARPMIDLLPGLTFMPPEFFNALSPLDFHSLDGVFWTLYAEVAFYIVFGLSYFILGKRWAIGSLILIWVVALLLRDAELPRALELATAPFGWFNVAHFGWFISGIFFAIAAQRSSLRTASIALVFGLASAFVWRGGLPIDLESRAFLVLVPVIFAAAVMFPPVQNAFSWRPLLFLGEISYPLYLLHGIALTAIAAVAKTWPPIPFGIAVAIALAATLGASVAVARYGEPQLRKSLRASNPRRYFRQPAL